MVVHNETSTGVTSRIGDVRKAIDAAGHPALLLVDTIEAITMLLEEGLDQVFARHQRLGAATRAAVRAWGLEVLCLDPAEYSPGQARRQGVSHRPSR